MKLSHFLTGKYNPIYYYITFLVIYIIRIYPKMFHVKHYKKRGGEKMTKNGKMEKILDYVFEKMKTYLTIQYFGMIEYCYLDDIKCKQFVNFYVFVLKY